MLAGLAAASLTASGLIWLNEGILEPLLVDETESQGRESKMLASILLVAGMGLLAASYPAETWSLAPLLATAGLGIVGAWMWSTDETRSGRADVVDRSLCRSPTWCDMALWGRELRNHLLFLP